MLILGIESASLTASAALVKDETVLAEYTVNFKKTHSQTLLPMIDEIVRMTQTDLKELDAIAVSAGPGSFTGLRIGSATAKGLGLALNKPLISVSTLAAMAWQCWESRYLICPIMDARRGQAYTALYYFSEEGNFTTLCEPNIVMMDEWLEILKKKQECILFIGDGTAGFMETIYRTLPDAVIAPAVMNRQRAAAVASLGAQYFAKGKQESAAEHLPCYLRKSQAEREREAKKGE